MGKQGLKGGRWGIGVQLVAFCTPKRCVLGANL